MNENSETKKLDSLLCARLNFFQVLEDDHQIAVIESSITYSSVAATEKVKYSNRICFHVEWVSGTLTPSKYYLPTRSCHLGDSLLRWWPCELTEMKEIVEQTSFANQMGTHFCFPIGESLSFSPGILTVYATARSLLNKTEISIHLQSIFVHSYPLVSTFSCVLDSLFSSISSSSLLISLNSGLQNGILNVNVVSCKPWSAHLS